MSKIVDPQIAEAIIKVREEKVRIIPGYDGVYGQLAIFDKKTDVTHRRPTQRSMVDFV